LSDVVAWILSAVDSKRKTCQNINFVNGRVSDKPRRLPRHQHAQAHNSTLYRRQHSFMYWLCSKQNCLLCAYECDFGDNDIIKIV
jgi:hypothetical protein